MRFHDIWNVYQKKTETVEVTVKYRSGDDRTYLRTRETPYRVDSELGRFAFETHEVVWNEKIVFKSTELFPAQRGKEYYLTQGFRECGMLLGATNTSYRKTTERLNRQRRQHKGGTPLNTFRDATEAEGKRVLNFWEAKTDAVLKSFGVEKNVLPPNFCDNVGTLTTQNLSSIAEVEHAMDSAEIPAELLKEARANSVPYEDVEQSANISVDGVVVKKQREKRRRPGAMEPMIGGDNHSGRKDVNRQADNKKLSHTPKKKKQRLNHKTATIEYHGKRYVLVTDTYVALFRTILAFVLNNGLQRLRLCFFTDGEISLKTALLQAFTWHRAFVVILDWHHLDKKCGELLSMAVNGRELRNEHRYQVTRLLWYGATQSAIDYLRQIPENQLKPGTYIEKLCTYIDKRRTMIPCYAVRKQLGLKNSSNSVEKANDQLVSSRQKHQGMSWSQQGSLALAALSAVVKNHHQRPWLQNRAIPFELAPSGDEASPKALDMVG